MRRTTSVVVLALVAAAMPVGLSARADQPAPRRHIETNLIGDAEDCLEAVPASFSAGYVTGNDPITIEVDVLLDGVPLEEGQRAMERADAAYAPLDLRLVPRFTPVAFKATGSLSGQEYVTRDDLFAQAKAHFGHVRPDDADVVYTMTTKDIHGASGGSTAGVADCIGGVRYPNRAFAIGQYEADTALPYTAKIAAHEIGHLFGAHHHYTNCVEGIPAGVQENLNDGLSGGFCTTMFPDLFFVSLTFGTFEAGVVRGHAEDFADRPVPTASPSPTASGSPRPRSSSSPSSTASPSDAADERVDHERTIRLRLQRHLTARGTVTAPGAPPACVAGVDVHLMRRSRGGWKRVRTVDTSGSGAFRVRLPDRPGRYAAAVEAMNVDAEDGCAAARSVVVRHRH